jgi:hypothetical protein
MFNILVSVQSKDITAAAAKQAVQAINVQLKNHFYPAWHIMAKCVLTMSPADPQTTLANGVMMVLDKANIQGALGYHDRIVKTGLPIGYVFQDICEEIGEEWSTTLSHEVLEMVLNRHTNYYALGPNPKDRTKTVAHWLEACDAVQDQTYTIGKVLVSDFVLPLFFTPETEISERVNYLDNPELGSFDVTSGGYIGYYDPQAKKDVTYFKSEKAAKRLAIKAKIKDVRRSEIAKKLLHSL